MTIEMETHQLDLKGVFSDQFEFEIPSYQRPYAWGAKQASELVEDVIKSSREGKAYFLGALVLVKKDSSEASVLDGQQRLTTLTILLAILRDMSPNQRAKDKRHAYLVQEGDEDARRKERTRLTPRPRDQSFFRRHFQTVDGTSALSEETRTETDSQANMLSVALAAKELLRDESLNRDSLFQFLLNDCFMVVIAVKDQVSARRIFTVLNARGVDLTPVDILKAGILDRVGDAADAYAQRWEAVEDRMGRAPFADLFAILLKAEGHAVDSQNLDTAFPELYRPFDNPETFLGNILEPAADFLALVDRRQDARTSLGKAGAQHLKSLSRLGDREWLCVALAHFLRIPHGEWLSQTPFLSALEQAAYFMAVTEEKKPERIARYANMCAFARAGHALPPLSDPERAAFREKLSKPIYGKDYCRPVMLRLDDILANNGVSYDDPVTIEHVLPQTPSADGGWAKAFPDRLMRQSFWPNLLGNLVFLTRSVNSRASNADYEEKKRIYVDPENGVSAYPITMDLFANQTWNLATLEIRHKRVVDRLSKTWGLVDGIACPEPEKIIRDETPTYRLVNRNVELALAYERDGQFVVLRGSRCLSKKFKTNNYAQMRDRLIAQGIIAPEGQEAELVFKEPYAFPSVSAACSVVLNRNGNARQDWREIGTDRSYAEASQHHIEPGTAESTHASSQPTYFGIGIGGQAA